VLALSLGVSVGRLFYLDLIEAFMNLLDKQKLQQRQSLDLGSKVQMSKQRIKDWFNHFDGDVYLAFSGGKDSTVLKHIIEGMGYSIPCVFSNTGLEMPEIVKFARAQKNIVEIRPKKTFDKIWKEEGLPVGSKKVAKMIRVLQEGDNGKNSNMHKLYDTGISKDGRVGTTWKIPNKWRRFVDSDISVTDKCCDYLKKEPLNTYAKKTGFKRFDAMMADEGGFRGELSKCNDFGKKPASHPMLFWLEQDIFEYIEKYNVEICEVYFDREFEHKGEMVTVLGEKRTGCMFCGFGAHLEKGKNRFQKMDVTHPRQHAIVMDRMGMRKAMELIDVKVEFDD
jgi:3'-phosphoadenosine 5'-phosphosulfate sulfotransferase (PAPS reductase)/FAD synthetase